MRGARVISLILAAVALAGCSMKKLVPDTVSLADRCGAIMQTAMPFAQIELGDRTAHGLDVRTIITEVSGTRTDLPKDAAEDRDLAAECTFEDNVMTAFRWTKGGPLPPGAGDATPPAH
ncbi:MAG TPA: hypothetical protein VNV38_09375 [Stellaceae bacterium]|jgi:hypothetical protein|nr:hypothetical protein [Stellaceae bacterium]